MRGWLSSVPAVALAAVALTGAPQGPVGDPLSNDGVVRATARVDSVFVQRTAQATLVPGGDWGSYLMARLGVVPIPPDLRLRVQVDQQHITLAGRIADLPDRTRDALGPLFIMVPASTPIAAEIVLARVGRELIRFRLATARINGLPVPETLLDAVLQEVARQYRVPGENGRDLFVQIPPDGNVELVRGGVRLSTAFSNGDPDRRGRRP